MATAKSDTTPYWSTSTTFPQCAKLADNADADAVVVGGALSASPRELFELSQPLRLHRQRLQTPKVEVRALAVILRALRRAANLFSARNLYGRRRSESRVGAAKSRK
jgi:hypothetical protein